MLRKEHKPIFTAPFFKKYKIKGYPIDPATMDLESSFIYELMDSLKAGYDKTKPILLARSEDDRLDGFPIDGRCRLYALAKNLERGIPLPQPFPISYIEVKDANELRALIASYEEKNRSKGSKYSKAWVDQNLKAIIEDKIEEQGDKIGDYIKSLGFTNMAIISKMVDDYSGAPTKKKNKHAVKKRPVTGLPEHLQNTWKADDVSSSSVYAGKDERFDIKVSYKPCPDCKNLLKITTDLQGTVLKVELAPAIKN